MLEDGEKLVGRYLIEKKLGKGGMGKVYQAIDELRKRRVAIKEFALGYLPSEAELRDESKTVVKGSKPTQLSREKALEQFKHEAELLVNLQHPNLPEIYDFFILGTEGYIIMTLVEGRSLADELEAYGQPFSEEQVTPWILQILEALIYCHSQGVIHRDLKPENLLLSANNKIFLVDFGIAKPFLLGSAAATTTGARAYSPGFAPTEQYAGKGGTDPRSDLYSLGAVAYCLLTCEIPMDAAERMSEDGLVPPRQLNPSISPAMEEFILACMQLRKADRPASASAARGLLLTSQGQGTQPIPAPVSELVEATPRSEIPRVITEPALPPQPLKAPPEASSPFQPVKSQVERPVPLSSSSAGWSEPYPPDQPDESRKGGKWLLFGAIGLALIFVIWQIWPNLTQPVATPEAPLVEATKPPEIALPTAAPTALEPTVTATMIEPTSIPVALPVGQNTNYPLRGEAIRPENLGQIVELARWGKGTINQALWSPDGSQIAVASSLGLYLYTSDDFTRIILLDTGGWVSCIDYSPDGEYVVAGLNGGMVQLWDVRSMYLVYSFQATDNYNVRSVAFSPDGFSFATSSSENVLKLWQRTDGSLIKTYSGPTNGMRYVDFSSDGSMLVSWSRSQTDINFWDMSSGTLLRTQNYDGTQIYDLTFSPADNILGLGNRDGAWSLWDVSSSSSLYRSGISTDFSDLVIDIAFSSDGSRIAVGGYDGKVLIVSTYDNGILGSFWVPGEYLRSLSFSPDGNLLLALNFDFSLSVWKVPDGEQVQTFNEHAMDINQVSVSPDGSQVAFCSTNSMIYIMWTSDGSFAQILQGNPAGYNSLAYSPDGRLLAAGAFDGTIDLWSVSDGSIWQTLTGHSGSVNQVVFSPYGNTLASVSDDQSVRLWQVANGAELATFNGHTDVVTDVAFSPDGNFLASGSADFTVKFWRIANRELIYNWTDHSGWVQAVDFSPDGQTIVSGSDDGTIRMWDVNSGTLILTIETGVSILDVIYSPDGGTVVSTNTVTAITFWNPSDGAYLGDLVGHRSTIKNLVFSPDQTILVSGSYDNTLRLWGIP